MQLLLSLPVLVRLPVPVLVLVLVLQLLLVPALLVQDPPLAQAGGSQCHGCRSPLNNSNTPMCKSKRTSSTLAHSSRDDVA